MIGARLLGLAGEPSATPKELTTRWERASVGCFSSMGSKLWPTAASLETSARTDGVALHGGGIGAHGGGEPLTAVAGGSGAVALPLAEPEDPVPVPGAGAPGFTVIGWGQGVFVADSPRACHEFLETVTEVGLPRVISGYLGERATLSVQKTTLRRADIETKHPEWHQDGAFLGKGVRTVNAWMALSRCGEDAPGLDVIPVRIPRVLATGATGPTETFFDWVVSAETILRRSGRHHFTGAMLGLYATGNGVPSTAPADFDWFEYVPARG